jgi:hypothetical protein
MTVHVSAPKIDAHTPLHGLIKFVVWFITGRHA